MKLTLPHWAIVVLTILVVSLPKVAQEVPVTAPYVAILMPILTLLIAPLGIFSTSAQQNAKDIEIKKASLPPPPPAAA
jgi:hypothetical protein